MTTVRETHQRAENARDSLQQELKERDEAFKNLTRRFDIKSNELCGMEKELRGRDAQVDQLNQLVGKLNSQLSASQLHVAGKEETLRVTHEKLSAAQRDVASLRQTIDDEQRSHAESLDRLKQKDERVSAVEATIERNRKDIASLKQQLEDKENDLTNMRESMESKSEQLKTFQELLRVEQVAVEKLKGSAQSAQENHESRMRERESQVRDLEVLMDRRGDELSHARQQIEHVNAQLQQLNSRFEDQTAELGDARTMHAGALETIEKLQNDQEAHNKQMEASRDKLLDQIARMDEEMAQQNGKLIEWSEKFTWLAVLDFLFVKVIIG